jgi:opacity protein-like surface antigen
VPLGNPTDSRIDGAVPANLGNWPSRQQKEEKVKGKKTQTVKTIGFATLILALLVGATAASAQTREGRWQVSLGTGYQFGKTIDGEHGSTMKTDNDFTWALTTGFNVNDNVEVNFNMGWANVGYDANVVRDNGNTIGISGTYSAWSLGAGVSYNFIDGPITPYVGAGIGWTWVDTNIPTGPSQDVCWWDPWWGYVCYSDYPTATTDGFTYQASVGLRYDINFNTFMKIGYASQWIDAGKAKSTPRFDVATLQFGWIF